MRKYSHQSETVLTFSKSLAFHISLHAAELDIVHLLPISTSNGLQCNNWNLFNCSRGHDIPGWKTLKGRVPSFPEISKRGRSTPDSFIYRSPNSCHFAISLPCPLPTLNVPSPLGNTATFSSRFICLLVIHIFFFPKHSYELGGGPKSLQERK